MNPVLRRMAIAIVAATFGIQRTPVMARDCVMDAYETYQFATQRLALNFKCGRNWKQENWPWDGAELRFQADPADGLSCVGVTPLATTEPSLFHASFFRIYGIQYNTKNSWKITGYEIAGGKYTFGHDRDSLISFDFAVAGQGSAFKYALHTITFSKPDGVCSDALAQAFDRPE